MLYNLYLKINFKKVGLLLLVLAIVFFDKSGFSLFLFYNIYIGYKSYNYNEPIGFSLIYSSGIFLFLKYSVAGFVIKDLAIEYGYNKIADQYGYMSKYGRVGFSEGDIIAVLAVLFAFVSVFVSIKMIKYRSKYVVS